MIRIEATKSIYREMRIALNVSISKIAITILSIFPFDGHVLIFCFLPFECCS